MKLSVIVPVYNVEQYVESCLKSLADQTYGEMEVIVVDDGSTDQSGMICREFIGAYENFFYYHKENGGLMSAWLMGVKLARGKYIGFVDSDDFVDSHMYDEMMKEAEANNADVVMCNHNQVTQSAIRPSNSCVQLKNKYIGDEMEYVREHTFSSLSGFNISNERWNKIICREILLNNIRYCVDESRYHEAKYIIPACMMDAKTFVYVDKPLYFLRARKASNGRVSSNNLLRWTEHLYQTQQQMLRDKGLGKYQNKLDEAKIDYLRIVIKRNLCNIEKTPLSVRIKLARELIVSYENRRVVLNNKYVCRGKMGKLIYYSYFFYSPFLLTVGATIHSALQNEEKDLFA